MIPTFATAGVLIAPSSPLQTSGYVPGNTLGAQTFNWFLNHLTAELNNLLLSEGISQSTADDTQVALAVYAHATRAAVAVRDASVLVPSTTSYAMPGSGSTRFLMAVPTGSGSAIFNVQPAANIVGSAITVVKTDAGSGLIKVLANGSDVWEATGSATMWLGSPYQSITFVAIAAGKLKVLSGSPVPDQGVDTGGAGGNYALGKLVHLPLGNTTARTAVSGAPPATGNWSSAIQVAGLYGIPVGSKAIRAKVQIFQTPLVMQLAFSDNNANTPALGTSHPIVGGGIQTAGVAGTVFAEVDIPLNQAGQFYTYSIITGAGTGPSYTVVPVGYYTGD